MGTSDFRSHLRQPGDPRVAGIADYDAYSFADHALQIPRVRDLVGRWQQLYQQDFVGITTDGQRIPGLFPLAGEGAPVAAMVAAAQRLLAQTSPQQQAALCHPLQAREWRAWMNPEFYVHRFGLRLDEIAPALRNAVMDVLRASLSAAGFDKARTLMRINHFLGELVDAPRVMNEFSYNVNLFGTPSLTEPWGWNFYGHHLCLNCLVVGTQMVVSPVFMGAEPNRIDGGPWAGSQVFDTQERQGLELMRSLPGPLQQCAWLYRHKRDPAMPPGRIAVGDELHLGGAFQDNRIIPYEGAPVASFDRAQRHALLDLVASYVDHLPAGPHAAQLRLFERHLDSSHFCWIGGIRDESPFYYRIQGPVLMVEFDHHAGVFLANTEPEKFHIHTLVRTPNGNDYGMELVRQHCEHTQRAAAGRCAHCADTPAGTAQATETAP